MARPGLPLGPVFITADKVIPRTVLCLSDYPLELVRSWLRDSDVQVVIADREQPVAALMELLSTAEVVIADAGRRLFLDASAIERLERCRRVIVPAVGVEGSVDVEALQRRGIPFIGAAGYNADAVADWTLWAMLEAVRLPVDLRETGWGARELGRELGSLRIGLVGLGAIGGAVQRRLAAFGATVRYSSARPRAENGRLPLDQLFAQSDVISLHLPLTTETLGLIDGNLLAAMPAGSVLINAARGAVIVEDDLVAALRAGRPSRAVLDVFATEPLPADHPLRSLTNVRLTPHVAAGTHEARARVRALVAEQTRDAFGLPPLG